MQVYNKQCGLKLVTLHIGTIFSYYRNPDYNLTEISQMSFFFSGNSILDERMQYPATVPTYSRKVFFITHICRFICKNKM